MRYATVADDGSYSRPPHDKLVYGTMIFVRSYMMVRDLGPPSAESGPQVSPPSPRHPSPGPAGGSWTRPAV